MVIDEWGGNNLYLIIVSAPKFILSYVNAVIDDPYEKSLQPEITLNTHELIIEESAEMSLRMLEKD